MNRNEIVLVIESCALKLDNVSKRDMIRFGVPEEIAEIGIKLYSCLRNRGIANG